MGSSGFALWVEGGQNWQLTDQASIQRGTHSIKTGIDFLEGGVQNNPTIYDLYFDSLYAHGMARGGRVSTVVLGAFQVSERGDLANWNVPGSGKGGIGAGAKITSGRGCKAGSSLRLA